jgi:quercetin dioxygenase-like cupin family protein
LRDKSQIISSIYKISIFKYTNIFSNNSVDIYNPIYFWKQNRLIMKKDRLAEFTGGWFIGNFTPSLLKTNDVEVAVKHYKAGDYDKEHYHKIGTEYTVIVKGSVKMSGKEYAEGDVLTIPPMESTDFLALTDATTVVVKIPGASNDKYQKNQL